MINKIITSLPQVKLRGLGHATQRTINSPKQWRKFKSNVQASAGRSFTLLKYNFLKSIKKLMVDYHNHGQDLIFLDKIDDEIKKAYKTAYMLGLKASGLTLYQNHMLFKKLALPQLEMKESYWLNKDIFDKIEYIKTILKSEGKDLLYLIEIELLHFYQQGRIVGAPLYSFVYFNCDSGKDECNHLIDNSPWPREKVPELYPCCRFKVIPTTADTYRVRLIDF